MDAGTTNALLKLVDAKIEGATRPLRNRIAALEAQLAPRAPRVALSIDTTPPPLLRRIGAAMGLKP